MIGFLFLYDKLTLHKKMHSVKPPCSYLFSIAQLNRGRVPIHRAFVSRDGWDEHSPNQQSLPLSVLFRTHHPLRHTDRSAKRRSGGTPAFRLCSCRLSVLLPTTPSVIPTGAKRSGGAPHFAFALALSVLFRTHPPLRHPDRRRSRSGGTPRISPLLLPLCFSSHPPPPSSRPEAKPQWRDPRISPFALALSVLLPPTPPSSRPEAKPQWRDPPHFLSSKTPVNLRVKPLDPQK